MSDVSLAVLNPAFFPWWQKPEILWNDQDRQEAEAAGVQEGEFSYGMGWK